MKKLIVFLVALSLLALPLSGIVLALDGGVDEAGIELSNPTDLVTSPPDAG